MSRIIAIDYGKKRTGIAVTDPLQIIATGLITVSTEELFDFLKKYIGSEEVESIVFGYPTRDDGTDSEPVPHIKKAIEKCHKHFPDVPVYIQDESYTSKMAFQSMIDGGVKKMKRRDKTLIDKVSATIILQSFMESGKNKTI
jgi:putative holliday junction resolvase